MLVPWQVAAQSTSTASAFTSSASAAAVAMPLSTPRSHFRPGPDASQRCSSAASDSGFSAGGCSPLDAGSGGADGAGGSGGAEAFGGRTASAISRGGGKDQRRRSVRVRRYRYIYRRVRPRGAAHGAIKLYLLLYTTCTRVQTVSYNPYSCTGEMTPSIQVYTPDGSTRTAVQPVSLQMYSCAAGAMCAAHLCSTHHSRCTAVRTVLPGLCAGSGLTFFNN